MKKSVIIKNLLSEIIPQLAIIIISLFKSKAFLLYLGSDTLGVYQLYVQLMQYIALIDGGLGGAIVYRLYNPINSNNSAKIAAIKAATIKTFRIITLAVLVIGTSLSFLVPLLIKESPFSFQYIQFNFILYIISESLLYLTVYEKSIYTADEKLYKYNYIHKSFLIIKGLLEIVIILLGGSLTTILLSFIAINAIMVIVVKLCANRRYNIQKTNKKDYAFLRDIKDLSVHKIAGLVANNIDIIILSKLVGLKEVVVYSTYNNIFNSLATIVGKISTSSIASIGRSIDKKNENINTFVKLNTTCYYLAMISAIPIYFLVNSFIDIFYSGKIETKLSIALLFTIILIYQIIRQPLVTYSNAAGLFGKTRKCPIIEAIINLILSLILVNFWGINGVLIATIVSLFISEYCIKPKIIYESIFNKHYMHFYKISIKYLIILTCQLIVTSILVTTIEISSLLLLAISSISYALLTIAIVYLYGKYIDKQSVIYKRKQ